MLTNVPAEVCAGCGETYFSQDVMERMERILRSPRIQSKDTLKVPVVALDEAV